MRVADEQVDRLMLLAQKQLNEADALRQGEANNNPDTGFFVTHGWEYEFTDRA